MPQIATVEGSRAFHIRGPVAFFGVTKQEHGGTVHSFCAHDIEVVRRSYDS